MDMRAAAQARGFVAEATCPAHGAHVFDEARLLVSELVANAVRHGAPPITLEISCDGTMGLLVRVSDGSPAAPVAKEASVEDESGRGVALVDLISDAWGIEPTGEGKAVWFRIGLAA
ncbi:ATP-binding protein [Motilibacter sp. K478]|nr:ATP-binding protein [Motilibacter aurantiacus]